LSDDGFDDLLRCQGPLRFPYNVEEQAREVAGAEMIHAAIGPLWLDGIRVSVRIKERIRSRGNGRAIGNEISLRKVCQKCHLNCIFPALIAP